MYVCTVHYRSRAPRKCSQSMSKKNVVNSADVIALLAPAFWERNCSRDDGMRKWSEEMREREEEKIDEGRERFALYNLLYQEN